MMREPGEFGRHLRRVADEVRSWPLSEQRSQAIRRQAPPRHSFKPTIRDMDLGALAEEVRGEARRFDAVKHDEGRFLRRIADRLDALDA